ncbi:palmitoyltransferase ZDHHC22 [Callorhinchus milii]|uniref:Palmitoyltransferase n=1 Tax=Callorhinchus milii TaxID=7868 RepID=A0A4W3IIK7_CALMI|nr:palmitoyltransferase ZDHHC22 [Callorhinchus milii]|eukprot:gi/632983613/ref/XP_007908733.1/ PREDICTED: palmitoyltransferase ZDHHC22 [Callorhinchus milii]
MLRLRILNAVAPSYFLGVSGTTMVLQLSLFIPTLFEAPASQVLCSRAAHICFFLYISANVLGNYFLILWFPSECLQSSIRGCPEGGERQPGSHFCKLCSKLILRRDHHCFFTANCIGDRNMRYFLMFGLYTSLVCLYSLVLGVAYLSVEYQLSFHNPLTFLTLLPLSFVYFFFGTIPSFQLFLVLMLYIWLGIGLTCTGFCCQQLLLVARGHTWYQVRKGLVVRRTPWGANLHDVFGSHWLLGLFLPVPTVVQELTPPSTEKGKGS